MRMNEPDTNGCTIQKAGASAAADLRSQKEQLIACCQELADRVRTETLSRRSMQEMLRVNFPQCPEAELGSLYAGSSQADSD